MVLPIPTRPLDANLVYETLRFSDADAAFLVPALLEELSKNEDAVRLLKGLNYVGYAGGKFCPQSRS
jgi:hypothetical protein